MAESEIQSALAQYDVFVSFRGEDVRNNFLSHLRAALKRKGITAFIDDDLKRGEEISTALLKAIQASLISIVVFSNNYASSKWCLNELSEILECRRLYQHIVMPVFYRVDPSDVRKQAGSYAEAFNRHEETFKDEKDNIQRWKGALKETANLSGWDLCNKQEATFIEDVCDEILKKLNRLRSIDVDDGLVGIEARMGRLESFLRAGLSDVCILGIWGMGGIGKTTLARALFDKIKPQFDGCCFLKDVRKNQEKHGLLHLQEKLLSEVLELQRDQLNMDISRGFLKRRLRGKKVLIVLDDISDMEQLEDLAGGHDWFGPGSRIIITTRDRQLLNVADKVYEAEQLTDEEAMQLFGHHAFKKIGHPPEDYLELSKKAVNYAGGIPLALKVLGSDLCSQKKPIWESKLARLKRSPNEKVHNVLKLSYEGLHHTEKNILLDVACFFKGDDVGIAKGIWDACGFFPEAGLSVLIDKCLLSITNHSEFQMHDLIEEMGKEIVRQEDMDEPGKRSRLWDHEDILYVFKNNTGSKAIKGILLDLSKIKELELPENAFAEMTQLRFLKFFSRNFHESTTKIRLPHGLRMLPDSLMYLSCDGYPCKSLPSNFEPEKLVWLCLGHSHIKQLSGKTFKNLKHINLSNSKYLYEVPDISEAPQVEDIDLSDCIELRAIHASISTLSKLKTLNLKYCRKLRNLPSSICLKSLKSLYLSGCSNLQNFPVISDFMEHLSELHLSETAISNLPSSIENLIGLEYLFLGNCKNLVSLPDSICNLKLLQYLHLNGCENLQHLPENIGNLESLLTLDADGTSVKHVPSSIVCLKNITELSIRWCGGTTARSSVGCLSWLLPRSRSSPTASCMGLQLLLGAFQQLLNLRLCNYNLVELPSDLHNMHSLRRLNLSGINFESLPQSICNLPKLNTLDLSFCRKLVSLSKLPSSLTFLKAEECTSLESITSFEHSYINNEYVKEFKFVNCLKLKQQGNSILESIIQDILRSGGGPSISWGTIFPGNEIPECFSNQTTGDTITFQLSPHRLDKCLGFAVCVILSPDDAFCSYVNVYFKSIFEDKKPTRPIFHLSRGELIEVFLKEDHVAFGFIPKLHLFSDTSHWRNCNLIKLHAYSCGPSNLVKVKKLAVCLVNVEQKTQPTFNSSSAPLYLHHDDQHLLHAFEEGSTVCKSDYMFE